MKFNKKDVELELIAILQGFLAELGTPYQALQLNTSFLKLGLDSVSRAELFQRFEKKFQVSFPDTLLAEADSLNDIINYLLKSEPTIAHWDASKKRTPFVRSNINTQACQTLIDVVLLYGKNAPHQPHIYFQNEENKEEIITYGDLLHHALRVANGLKKLGLKENETVAIMQPTHPGFFYSFFGTLLAGGIPVPIYPPFRMHLLESYAKMEARILQSAEVRILITFKEAQKLSQIIKTFVPSLKHVVTVKDILANEAVDAPYLAKSNDLAFIQYTSGSTSDPKGVALSHFNLLSNIRAYGKAVAIQPDDVVVSWLPLYHDMGLIGMWLGSLYFGIPLVLLTPFSFLNHPERWLWAIHYYRGTLSGAPNFAYELCIKKIDYAKIEGLDLSSWRVAANGAEKVYPKTLELFTKKFIPFGLKETTLLPVYGLAESTVALAIPPLNRKYRLDSISRLHFEKERKAIPSQDKDSIVFVASGGAIDQHEIRIVNDDDVVLSERMVGNLQFRGPSSMQGYYRNVQATDAVLHNGWIDSGDLAYVADGEVFITGRRKDLIIKAGRNIYPAEIEELVSTVPGIRQGCVTAFSIDEINGTENLIVVAESREKNQAQKNQLIVQIKECLSTHLDIVPDQVIVASEHTIPKTSSGKLQRAACKKMYVAGQLSKKKSPPWIQMSRLISHWFLNKISAIGKYFLKLFYTLYIGMLILFTFVPCFLSIMFVDKKTAQNILQVYIRIMSSISFCTIHIRGKNYLNKKPVIFAANHASYIDGIILFSILPLDTYFVVKKELFRVPVLRTLLNKINCLSVDRLDFSKGVKDVQDIENILMQNKNVLIFPEGTFGYSSGLRPFRLGAFKIAAETKTSICPVALKGARRILRDSEKLISPGSVTVTIQEPIASQGSDWQDVIEMRNAVRKKIAEHCGEPSLDLIVAQTIAGKPPEFTDLE